MNKYINNYLKKRGICNRWTLSPFPSRQFNQVIVIPAFSELEYLPKTLYSINQNDIRLLKNTLVVIVVNNDIYSSKEVKNNNILTLDKLKKNKFNFTMAMVDAATAGFELPIKNSGVGLARKIGIDLSLPHLTSLNSLIFCTDADSKVSKNYLKKVIEYFKRENILAAVVDFSHIKADNNFVNNAIKQYENLLKKTAKKIKNSGSPYGYVSMGSTMVCNVNVYCAVGGMPKKRATEDFYFLQEIAKFCKVHTIPEKLVFPSSRPDSRVYLGTGFRLKQIIDGFDINSLYFSEDSFLYLSKWLKIGSNAWKMDINNLFEEINHINPAIVKFLKSQRIENVWGKIQKNASSQINFTEQFHRWFDGLKTIRFLKLFSRN